MKKRQSKMERQAQISSAALKIISEQGLRKFTTAAIAREVGISDGAIFKHFANKAAIIEAALERARMILWENFPPTAESPMERLRLFFEHRAQIALEHPYIMHLIQTEQLLYEAPGAGVPMLKEWKERSVSFIRESLLEAQAVGMVDNNLPIGPLVVLVYGALVGLLMTKTGRAPAQNMSTTILWRTLSELLEPRG